MITLNTEKISNIGTFLSDSLKECNIKESELIVYVDKNSLRKIDEDLFYRLNNSEKEFIPSDNEITVSFNNLKVIIKEKCV